ncbi:podocalyxin isoform X1 [Nothobranchius furzeri]|uniref:Podocalyxin n=1 Tax=Nothobranchius furzeri TaxID=105023 RepID=A0A1A8ARK8_NOTFU
MKTTLRITWLLLLLSVCSAEEETVTSPVPQKHTVVTSAGVPTAVMTTTKVPDTKAVTTAPPTTAQATEATTTTNKLAQEPTTTTTALAATSIIPTTAKLETTQPTSVGTSNSPTPVTDKSPLGKNPTSPTVAVSKPTAIAPAPDGTSSPGAGSTTLQEATSFKPTESFTSSDGNNLNAAADTEITTSSVDLTSGQRIDTTLPVTQCPGGETSKVTPAAAELASTQILSTVNPAVTFTTSILNKATTTVRTSYTTAEAKLQKTTNSFPAKTNTFTYSLLSGQETKENKDLLELCKKLMPDWQSGTCILTWRHHNNKVLFDRVELNGKVKTSLANKYYEEMTKEDPPEKPTDYKTLIAILASCGALLIMIVILTVCATHHRKPCNENQQYLTEELHTVENCYHDNPTLEVMEVQPEMQEKKMVLNGEFNDSWIVPIDNLMKEDLLDEEDTHL